MYDDQALLTRLAAGDQQAFAQIYRHYHQPVYYYLVRMVKMPSIAEDLVHEVFMKLWEMRERLRIHTSLSAYIFKASRNKAIDMLHKIAADDALRTEMILFLDTTIPESIASLQAKEYEGMIYEAVEAMPPQRKKVFKLCREQGRSYDEVAVELGISRNTVKEHMIHALRYIRTALLEKGDFAIAALLMHKLL